MAIRPRTAAPGAGACVAMLLVVGFASFHVAAFSHVFAYTRAHVAFLVGAAGIGALGLAPSTGVALSVRR